MSFSMFLDEYIQTFTGNNWAECHNKLSSQQNRVNFNMVMLPHMLQTLENLEPDWVLLAYPPYSFDIAPSDSQLFRVRNIHSREKTIDDLQDTSHSFLNESQHNINIKYCYQCQLDILTYKIFGKYCDRDLCLRSSYLIKIMTFTWTTHFAKQYIFERQLFYAKQKRILM